MRKMRLPACPWLHNRLGLAYDTFIPPEHPISQHCVNKSYRCFTVWPFSAFTTKRMMYKSRQSTCSNSSQIKSLHAVITLYIFTLARNTTGQCACNVYDCYKHGHMHEEIITCSVKKFSFWQNIMPLFSQNPPSSSASSVSRLRSFLRIATLLKLPIFTGLTNMERKGQSREKLWETWWLSTASMAATADLARM